MLLIGAGGCAGAGAAIVICVHVSWVIARGSSQVHGPNDASILAGAILCRVQISLEAMETSFNTPSSMSILPKMSLLIAQTPDNSYLTEYLKGAQCYIICSRTFQFSLMLNSLKLILAH